MKYKLILVTLFLILSLTIVSAKPPFQEPSQQSPQDAGYLIIETGWAEYHQAGEDFYIHTHVYNGTNGLLITEGIDCYYHFYNHQIKGGEHIDTGSLSSYGAGYYNYTNGSLLTDTGQYSVLLWCNSTSMEGGFTKFSFFVTPDGKSPASISIILILILGSLSFGFFAWFYSKDAFLHILFLFASMLIVLYAINNLHIPILFFTSVVIVLLAFVYYIINYVIDILDSANQRRGFEV